MSCFFFWLRLTFYPIKYHNENLFCRDIVLSFYDLWSFALVRSSWWENLLLSGIEACSSNNNSALEAHSVIQLHLSALLQNGPFPASFFFISVFSIQLTINDQFNFLPMTGFEPRTSGIGSNHSTNWITTTAQVCIVCCNSSCCRFTIVTWRIPPRVLMIKLCL